MLDPLSLRRIALLVLRAREDASPGSLHDGLVKIGPVIERMKRSVALGSSFEKTDVANLVRLVRRLPEPRSGREHSACEVVQFSAIDELRDLVACYTPLVSSAGHSSSS